MESVQQSIHHLSGVQQEADRSEATGLCRRDVARAGRHQIEQGLEIRPGGRDETACAVRQHQCQMQDASSVRGAVYDQKLSQQCVALPHDRDLRREVVDAGSV